MADWDFYEVHEVGTFGKTLSAKRYKVKKVKPTGSRLDDWFWTRD
jgi:hypothetical protein